MFDGVFSIVENMVAPSLLQVQLLLLLLLLLMVFHAKIYPVCSW